MAKSRLAPPAAPIWAQRSSFVLALAGLAISAYLTVERLTTPTLLACPDTGIINCQKVTDGARSSVFGVPVVLLGLLFFVVMAALTHPRAWADRRPWITQARVGLAVTGVLFVFYLIWVELFVVDAICLWCTAVHAVAIGLFGVILLGITDRQPAQKVRGR